MSKFLKCVLLLLLCLPAEAQDVPVDLELSLVVDTSNSIDNEEYGFMMEGYARVFENSQFVESATSGQHKSIAVNLILFARNSSEAIAWRKVSTAGEMAAFARDIRNVARLRGNTRIRGGLVLSSKSFTNNGFTARKQIISISGDGGSVDSSIGRDSALAAGVDTIHGIVTGDAVGGGVEQHYRDQVIGGESPLLCTARNFGEFQNAILFKLTNVLRLLTGDCPVFPTTLSFDKPLYEVDLGKQLAGSLVIDPVPVAGLYSMGVRILVRDQSGSLAGVINPVPNAVLNFDGLMKSSVANSSTEVGSMSLKGSADFFAVNKPVLFDPSIADFSLSSLPAGTYDLSMALWNELGDTENIFVTGCCQTLDSVLTLGTAQVRVSGGVPVLSGTTALRVEPQTGLIEQKLTLTNNGGSPINKFRIYADNSPVDVTLKNAHGTEGGVPYIDIFTVIQPGQSITVTLEYYRANRNIDFAPAYRLETTTAVPGNPNPGGDLKLDLRVVQVAAKGVLVEFNTVAGKTYTIEYTDNMTDWQVSKPSVLGTGQRIQWLDSGPPKTLVKPGGSRFYRVTDKP